MRASRRTVAIAAVAALLAVLVLARHTVERVVLSKSISVATGYDVSIGRTILGWRHSALFDVHVSKNGDPVLDAQRVDVEYSLRDIFPGGAHRYGFASLAIQKPVITITRHADGTLTFNRAGGTGPAPPQQTRKAAAPYYFTARVRDGTIRLVDAAPLQPDLAYQTIDNVTIDASVKSDARTTARVSGVWVGRRAQGAPLRRYPIAEKTVIDVHRGIGLNDVRAAELPLRGALGFFIHSRAVRFDDGVIDNVHVQMYALAPKAGDPLQYEIGGGMDLRGGRIAVGALARPVRDLSGHLGLAGGAMTADTLSGTVAGLPLHGRGAFYDLFGTPQAWMGITGDGNLATLRALFAFANGIPLAGPVHVETLFASKLDNPLIRNAFTLPRIDYDRYPFEDVTGLADIYGDAVVVHGIRAHFGQINALLGGRVIIKPQPAAKGTNGDDILFAVDASGPGSSLPYADALAPDSGVHATALISEVPGINGWLARGTIDAQGNTDGGMTFAVNNLGVGEFGPFAFARRDGSTIAGGFELERPISQSAGWLNAHAFRLSSIRAVPLPGVQMPTLPPISGVLDGQLAAGGTPDVFAVAGTVHARDLRYANLQLGNGSVRVGGTFSDVRLADIALDGPTGRFNGSGALANGVFALEGRYDGSLAMLEPFFGPGMGLQGGAHGPIRATVAGGRIAVQTTGVDFTDATVRGVPVQRVAGTLLVQGKSVRVIAADADVAGGHAVAGDAGGPFLVSAPALSARALRGTGVPLQGGTLSLLGVADLTRGAPRFDGSVLLANGVAAGYPFSGGADVAFDGRRATVRTGVAAFEDTYGSFDGTIDPSAGPGQVSPTYDLQADVPLGDVNDITHALHLPLRTLEGSFSANVRVRGAGAQPRIAGRVNAPEGEYNGLAFRNARADLTLTPRSMQATNGSLVVGSTHAAVAASIGGGAFDLNVRSAAANLADFNDYFDTAETLAGTGSFAVDFENNGHSTRSSGRVAMHGVRYRQFPFGTADATWSQRPGRIVAALNAGNGEGTLRANGSVTTAPGGPLHSLLAANYDVRATAHDVALGAWLPPFGITAPVLGSVDATATVAGRYPNLNVALAANLRNGSLYGLPVVQAQLGARSNGRRIALSNTDLDLGFARFDAGGSVGMSVNDPLALSIHGTTPDLHHALLSLRPRTQLDVGGALDADARVTGTVKHPLATVGFSLTQGRYRSLTVPHVLGSVAYDGRMLEVQDAEATFTKGSAFVAGSLPLSLQPLGVPPHAPFSFTLSLSGVDLSPFAPLVPTPHSQLGGTVDGRVAIEGTPERPRIVGSIALANGSYESDFDRAPITKANAKLTFAGTSVDLTSLAANVGGGTVTGAGRLDLPFPNAPPSGYAIALDAKAARFDLPAYATGQFDGTLRLQRAGSLPEVSGEVTLTNTTIPFGTILRQIQGAGGGAAGAAPAGPPFDLAFDMIVHAGKNVAVRGSIIDVGATGTLALTGTLSHPQLAGQLTAPPGGVVSTYNRAFRVQQATVTFDPANGVVPFIDARAFAHVTNPDPDPTRNAVGSADITIVVSGPADELATGNGISYTSNPPYDQAQIVGLLLDASVFGAVNFGTQQNGTILPGAPGESNALLPPGVTPYQSGTVNFNQEAFSIINGQLVQRFIAPIDRVLAGTLSLSDVELTVDYGGGVGYQLYKQIGHRDVYANFGQNLTAPIRTSAGFSARPDATTSITFYYYQQSGVPSISPGGAGNNAIPFYGSSQRLNGISPLASPGGFTLQIVRKYP